MEDVCCVITTTSTKHGLHEAVEIKATKTDNTGICFGESFDRKHTIELPLHTLSSDDIACECYNLNWVYVIYLFYSPIP